METNTTKIQLYLVLTTDPDRVQELLTQGAALMAQHEAPARHPGWPAEFTGVLLIVPRGETDLDRWLPLRKVAEDLGINISTLNRQIEKEALPAERIGWQWVVTPRGLAQWAASRPIASNTWSTGIMARITRIDEVATVRESVPTSANQSHPPNETFALP